MLPYIIRGYIMIYKHILAVLNDIKNGNIEAPEHGICANIERLMHVKYNASCGEFINEAAIHIFGKPNQTPVEGDIISYLNNKNKWDKETEFGLRRYGYLDKLIAYAEDKLKEEVL